MVQTGRHLNKKGWGTVVPRINVENAVAGGWKSIKLGYYMCNMYS
jgi:predicted DNA-binding protein (MmcQ/YjbR family)